MRRGRTEMRVRAALAGLALAIHASAGLACGYCIEDKIASVYDHAVVTQALARKHQVAFFHLDGTIVPGEAARHIVEAAVISSPGVDKGTVRVAVETLTVSFAFDPSRTTTAALQSTLDRKLRAKRLALMPLRVIDSPAELKLVKR